MEIISATALGLQKLTALLYGPPGAGKTTAIQYLPGKTLVFDVDRTSGVLAGCQNIDICYVDTIDTWTSWSKLVAEIGNGGAAGYDNVCVDNISELERGILAALGREGKNNGVPAQADYQFMQFKLVNSLRYLKTTGANVVLTAWETSDQYTTPEGQIYTRAFPQISAKIVNNICGLCNLVGRLVTKPDGTRGFVLTGSPGVYAKNQFDDRKGCLQAELLRPGSDVRPAHVPDTLPLQAFEAPRCQDCGGAIAGDAKRTGEQVVAGTRKAYGKALCLPCAKRYARLAAHMDKTGWLPPMLEDALPEWVGAGLLSSPNIGALAEAEFELLLSDLLVDVHGTA